MPSSISGAGRALLSLLLSSSLLACSTTSTIQGAQVASGLQDVETSDGSFRLRGADGSSVYVRPQDTLRITTGGGAIVEGKGKDFCRSPKGLFLRDERDDDSECRAAIRIGSWDDIAGVEVEQFDGAATVGVVAFAAAVATVIVVAVLANSKKSSSWNLGSGGHVGSVINPRAVAFGVYALQEHRRREAAAIRVADPQHWGGAGGARPIDGDDDAQRTPGASANAANAPEPRGGYSVVTRDGVPDPVSEIRNTDAADAAGATPLFSGRAQRRANFRPSLRVDGGLCATGSGCLAGSARVAMNLVNLVELSGGVRWEDDPRASVWATFGAGLHGQFPAIPRLAIFFGSQIAVRDDAFRVAPSLGMRVRPFADFWVGVQPVGMTYFSEQKRFAYTPSLEMAYEF